MTDHYKPYVISNNIFAGEDDWSLEADVIVEDKFMSLFQKL
jgi:hypothetical protein